MIKNLVVRGFRSIKEMSLDLGKITVLTGANNSGKSSVIYSLLVMKNAITNPNQATDSIFNLGFINLGGYKEAIYRKEEDDHMNITLTVDNSLKFLPDNRLITYGIDIGGFFGPGISVEVPSLKIKQYVGFEFPYTGSESVAVKSEELPDDISIVWNGLTAKILRNQSGNSDDEKSQRTKPPVPTIAYEIQRAVDAPIKFISSIDFTPIRRGFTKPFFAPVPLTQQITTEDEIATMLYSDRELVGEVAHYLEKIVDRRFSVNPVPNTTNFYLQTRDEKTGLTADLVNEGLGTNQLVTILAKALYQQAGFICIDEPEIHLHPTLIDKLVNVLIDIANDKGRQFLISTHSEQFINALLSAIIKKRINPEEVKVYHLTKEGWNTKAEEQKINDNGQIEGGLAHFYAAELANWSTFFKTDE